MTEKFSMKELISFAQGLPLGTILWGKQYLVQMLASLVLPDPDKTPLEATDQERRAFVLNAIGDDKRMLEPSMIHNRPPWTQHLYHCLSFERFLQFSILARLSDPFQYFMNKTSMTEGSFARWVGSLEMPSFSQRERIDIEFQELVDDYRISCFHVPSDLTLIKLGYLSRGSIDPEDRDIWVDADHLGGDPRMTLTQKPLAYPLARHAKCKQRWLVGGEEWFYQIRVGDLKRYHHICMNFARKRWRFYREAKMKTTTFEVVQRILKRKQNGQDQEPVGS